MAPISTPPQTPERSAISGWLRDIGRYLLDITARRPFGGVFGIIGLVLAVISGIKHSDFGLSPLGWIAVALGATVMAGFVTWRDLARRPITQDHATVLRTIATGLEMTLQTPSGVARYRHGANEDPILRRMFRSHFDDIGLLIDDLDTERQGLTEFVTSRDNLLTKTVMERFPQDQGWDSWNLLSSAKGALGQFGRRSTPPRLDLHAIGNLIMWGQVRICTMPSGSTPDALIADIRQWFDEIWDSPQMAVLGERWELYEHSKRKVISALHKVKWGDTESMGGRCEQCSRTARP